MFIECSLNFQVTMLGKTVELCYKQLMEDPNDPELYALRQDLVCSLS
jgi:hypothetical protein